MTTLDDPRPYRRIAESVRQAIAAGDLTVGSKVVKRQLAREHGVCLQTAMKAVRLLEQARLIEPCGRQGWRVITDRVPEQLPTKPTTTAEDPANMITAALHEVAEILGRVDAKVSRLLDATDPRDLPGSRVCAEPWRDGKRRSKPVSGR